MSPISIRGVLACTSTVALLCGTLCVSTPQPEASEPINAITQSLAKPWENLIDQRYQTWLEKAKLATQIKIIHGFASKLLLDSKNIEPEIVAMVNEDFWELL